MCRLLVAIGNHHKREDFEEALALMKQGGPDYTGIEETSLNGVKVLMGHNRLSIRDLSPASNQPFISPDKQRFFLFNGELYDKEKIDASLEEPIKIWNRDHRSTPIWEKNITTGDTETLMKYFLLANDYPQDLVKLSGEIACVLVSRNSKQIIAYRDGMGTKPLYIGVGMDGYSVVISSEVAPILKLIKPKQSSLGIQNVYLRYGFGSQGYEGYENVWSIKPGEVLQLSVNSQTSPIGVNHIRPYTSSLPLYDLPPFIAATPHLITRDSGAVSSDPKEVREIVYDSIRKRMISDVPISLTFSGGLDSSIIAHVMCKEIGPTFNAYTLVMSEDEEPELERAQRIAKYYGFNLIPVHISERTILKHIDRIVERMEEPMDKGSTIPTYFLARAIQEKVTLIGEGADELFMGYNRHREAAMGHTRTVDGRVEDFYSIFHASELMPNDRLYPTTLLTTQVDRDSQFYHRVPDYFPNYISRMDLATEIPSYHCMRIDKMFSTFGKEARIPYLDPKVVQMAIHIPYKKNIEPPKKILREAFEGEIPGWILNYPKKALKIPYMKYVQNPEIKNLIMKEGPKYVTMAAITSSYDAPVLRNSGRRLWQLFLFIKWHQIHDKK